MTVSMDNNFEVHLDTEPCNCIDRLLKSLVPGAVIEVCGEYICNTGAIMDGQTLKTGEKKDEGKSRLELVPYDAVRGVADILTIGSIKYSARNWELGIAYGRVFGAVQRHLTSWWQGENLDPESGKSHIDHALTELMFLSAYEKRGMSQFDDRPIKKFDCRQG